MCGAHQQTSVIVVTIEVPILTFERGAFVKHSTQAHLHLLNTAYK